MFATSTLGVVRTHQYGTTNVSHESDDQMGFDGLRYPTMGPCLGSS